jgi:hypothetical protein
MVGVNMPSISTMAYRGSFISSQTLRHPLNSSTTRRSRFIQSTVRVSLSWELEDSCDLVNKGSSAKRSMIPLP